MLWMSDTGLVLSRHMQLPLISSDHLLMRKYITLYSYFFNSSAVFMIKQQPCTQLNRHSFYILHRNSWLMTYGLMATWLMRGSPLSSVKCTYAQHAYVFIIWTKFTFKSVWRNLIQTIMWWFLEQYILFIK